MTELTDDRIRQLASFDAGDRPVVSLYLDVDGRRWPKFQDCEARVERMVRDLAGSANGHLPDAKDDLSRVESHVRAGLDRSETRGLAVFSSGDDLFEVFELAVPVRDQLIVNRTPHVHQLESVLATHERFAVLLTDRQRTRMFVFEMGRLVERSERFDALPRHDDDAGGKDRRHDRHKLEAAAHQHLKNAAAVAFDVFQTHPFDHLIVAAADDIAGELEADLHQYLRQRIAARMHIPVNASDAEIRDAAIEVEEEIARRKEADLVGRLRDAAGANTGGAVGLANVLTAISERRVETLLVSDGFAEEGFRCGDCRTLSATGPSCPSCAGQMLREADVVELAIEEAMLQSAHVQICVDNADLDVVGRVGALLRF